MPNNQSPVKKTEQVRHIRLQKSQAEVVEKHKNPEKCTSASEGHFEIMKEVYV